MDEKLTAKASPLFYFNNGIWSENQTSKLAFVSIPESSAPIKAAAAQLYNTDPTWGTKDSALTDRIFVMCSACTLPLSAYNNCAEYEKNYFSSTDVGRHYYEGKHVPGMSFDDWRELPSITPQSLIDLTRAPDPLKKIVKPAQLLYEEVMQYHILDDHSQICRPSAEGVATLKDLIDAVRADAAKLVKASDIAKAQDHLDKLKAVERIPMVRTEYAMQDDGYAEKKETKLSVQKDHFVSAPVLQNIAKEILEETKSLDAAKNEAIKLLEDKITRIGAGNRAIGEYCDALFTGVITLEDSKVVYRKNEFGIVTETVLSARDDAFAFETIPVYQGFLSYQSLLDDDTRAAIKKAVNDRYNSGSSEIKVAGTALKAGLADSKIQSWVMRADDSPEKAEIVDFIMKVKRQFNIFCMENDI